MKDTLFSGSLLMNCAGRLVELKLPAVMGILNVTPDSFYDGGKFLSEKNILEHAGKMLAEGASIIDVGAYSSRPGANHISENEELSRLLPAIRLLVKNYPGVLLSVDTFRSKVAEQAVNEGALMINDISAGNLDHLMMQTVAGLKVPYVMMHMKGSPQTMTTEAVYENIAIDVMKYFGNVIQKARLCGINDLILDPGFGFSKNVDQNFSLLNELHNVCNLGYPVLVGLSRKSMIWKTLETEPIAALNGTTVLNTIALIKGANILRVHDVKQAVETIKLISKLRAV